MFGYKRQLTNEDFMELQQIVVDYHSESNKLKVALDYFSVSADLLTNSAYMAKIRRYGWEYHGLYEFLKTAMVADDLFYIIESELKDTLEMFCLLSGSDMERAKAIFDDLIQTGRIQRLTPESLSCAVIVDPILFENYKNIMEVRKKARDRHNKKGGNADEPVVEVPPAPTAPSFPVEDDFQEPAKVVKILSNGKQLELVNPDEIDAFFD